MTATSTTVADQEEAESYISERVSSDAYDLGALAALMDADLHQLVLDPDNRTVWWAWDGAPVGQEGWTVEPMSLEAAADMLDTYVDLVEDRFEDPAENYAHGGDVDGDQDAMDEYTAILRLMLPGNPTAAAAQIKRKRQLVARQDARWQRTYANMVRDLAGPDRGGKARAAKALKLSDMQVGRIIRDDDQRRAELDIRAKAARA